MGDPEKDGEPKIELWDLNNQSLIKSWDLNVKNILNSTKVKTNEPNSVNFMHPLLLKDGSLVVTNIKPGGPLIKIGNNGLVKNINTDYVFHHSLEMDKNGLIYAATRTNFDPTNRFLDEGFAILDQDLKVIKNYSLLNIYKKNNLLYEIYSKDPTLDPFHINDIQPIETEDETKFVLLSLRANSSIIALDLETENIIWKLNGYVSQQHDVDLINPNGSHISIFDNNISYNGPSDGNIFVEIMNLPEINKYDLAKMKIFNYGSNHKEENELLIKKTNFNNLASKMRPKTISAGRSELVNQNNSLFIEESNYGRGFEIDMQTGDFLWQYINRKDNSNKYYRMSWSRRIKKLPESLILK